MKISFVFILLFSIFIGGNLTAQTADDYFKASLASKKNGKLDFAAYWADKAINIAKQSPKPDSLRMVVYMDTLGNLYFELNELKKAESFFLKKLLL